MKTQIKTRIKYLALLGILVTLLTLAACETAEPVVSEEVTVEEETSPAVEDSLPAYQSEPWVRLGGPPGGIGYDIRMRPDNPDVMFVTDVAAGVHKSVDGGRTWFQANEGIPADPTGGVPIFCLTIDPTITIPFGREPISPGISTARWKTGNPGRHATRASSTKGAVGAASPWIPTIPTWSIWPVR